jgi:hypothetical protein
MTDKIKTPVDLLSFLQVTRSIPVTAKANAPRLFGLNGTLRDTATLKPDSYDRRDSAASEERSFRCELDYNTKDTARHLVKQDIAKSMLSQTAK